MDLSLAAESTPGCAGGVAGGTRAAPWPRGWLLELAKLVYCSDATTMWIRPPLLPVLAVFDAGLVADAGGVKRASRRGYQSEQERSCDPLSGDRGEGVFHTT